MRSGSDAGAGIDPEELSTLASDLGYAVEIGCSREDPAAFDVLFRRPATVPDGDRPALVFDRTPPADGSLAGLTNNPLQEKFTRVFASDLLGHLKSKLPKP